jgi:hypothetical protein
MEILICLIVLLALDIGSWFWGADSRDLFTDDPNAQDRPRRAI